MEVKFRPDEMRTRSNKDGSVSQFPIVGGRLRLAHELNDKLSVTTELISFKPLEDATMKAQVAFLKRLPRTWKYLLHDDGPDRFYDILSRRLKAAISKAGLSDLKRFTPHGLRHTWFSTALRNGLDTRTVMAYSGHTNMGTVQKYAHLVSSPERMRDDAARFIKLGQMPLEKHDAGQVVKIHCHHTATDSIEADSKKRQIGA